MKQTAVQWLVEQWPILESQIPERILEQAKEMEKQQILYAYECGFFDPQSNKDLLPLEGSEQYYTETYESNT